MNCRRDALKLVWGLVPAIICCLLPVLLTGCSIKEDRSGCPCRLVLDFSEVDPAEHPELTLTVTAEKGYSHSAVISPESGDSGYPSMYVVEVPRAGVFVNVWSGVGEDYLSESGMAIPIGKDCPPVYRHFADVDTDAEVVSDKVVMHKQYCSLSLFLVNETTPYSMKVKGEVDGYVNNGSLSEGEFSCVAGDIAGAGSGGDFVARLPRQSDASLLLDIIFEGSVLKTFALGNYIEASGYDWESEDLGDLTVGIDYSDTVVTLTISGWKESFTYELTF